jgi:uncharacterized Ntn-hydrolase superfamily protein
MTWSIVARDGRTGAFGVAIATRFFAVGALCPHVESGVGGLATQALVNPLYGPQGLALLRAGVPAAEIVQRLTTPDEGRDFRQLHVIDAKGGLAQHTGSKCVDWCGHVAHKNFSVAGNMLAGARVVEDTAAAFAANSALPFAERLIAAMEAGDAAGGDKRGRQSAALLVHSTEDYADLDLRVDDHEFPLVELKRLYEKAHERFIPYLACAPSRSRPFGELDRPTIDAAIARHVATRTAGSK